MPTNRRKHPAPEVFRKRLAMVLDWRDLKPADLARGLKLTDAAISQWMTGSVMPGEDNQRRAAEWLDEDLEWLVGRSDRGSKGLGALVGRIADKYGVEGLETLDALTPEQARKLLDAARESVSPPPKRPTRPKKS